MSAEENQLLIRAAAGEFQTPKWNQYNRTVPAGGITIIDAEGTFCYMKEASGPLLIAFDTGPDMPVDVGTGMRATRKNDVFSKVIFRNPFADPVELTAWIGYGEFIDNRFTLVPSRDFAIPVIDAPTETLGVPVNLIASGATLDLFPGIPAGAQVRRRSVQVSNLDPNGRLKFKDRLGNLVSAIEPKSSQVLFTSGDLKLFNDSGADISFISSETWYLKGGV